MEEQVKRLLNIMHVAINFNDIEKLKQIHKEIQNITNNVSVGEMENKMYLTLINLKASIKSFLDAYRELILMNN